MWQEKLTLRAYQYHFLGTWRQISSCIIICLSVCLSFYLSVHLCTTEHRTQACNHWRKAIDSNDKFKCSSKEIENNTPITRWERIIRLQTEYVEERTTDIMSDTIIKHGTVSKSHFIRDGRFKLWYTKDQKVWAGILLLAQRVRFCSSLWFLQDFQAAPRVQDSKLFSKEKKHSSTKYSFHQCHVNESIQKTEVLWDLSN